MPTILITGGAGYIGSHTALYMVQKGYQVIVLDNFLHNQEFNPAWAKVIKGDFSDEDLLNEIFSKNKIDAVMHFAAFIEVGESVKVPLKFYINNVSKTLKLIEMMQKYHVNKFIFSSSCAVYGNPEYLPLDEIHATNPINPYGQCKLIIEKVLKDLNNYSDFLYVALRYFNAAGSLPEHGLGEQHFPETHLIPLLLEAAQNNKQFIVYGTDYSTKDGTCIRDFLHVWDIAEAHWLALKHLEEGNPSDCFNLGTGQGFSIKEIIQNVENLYRTKLKIIYSKKREGDPAVLIANPTKANLILKWKPKYSSLDFILRSAYSFQHKRIELNQSKFTI